MDRLVSHFQRTFDTEFRIIQAEVSYIKSIEMADLSRGGDYLDFIDTRNIKPEGFAANFVETISDSSHKNIARMYHELQTVELESTETAVRFTLTVRGNPSDTASDSARRFLDCARCRIVARFRDLTTLSAHEKRGMER